MSRISLFNGCGADNTISMRVPYGLFVDMIQNCPMSDDKKELLQRLKYMKKAEVLARVIEEENLLKELEE